MPGPPKVVVDEPAEYGAKLDDGRCGGESRRLIGAEAVPDNGEGLWPDLAV